MLLHGKTQKGVSYDLAKCPCFGKFLCPWWLTRPWWTLEPTPPVCESVVVAKSTIVAFFDVLSISIFAAGHDATQWLVSSPLLLLHLPDLPKHSLQLRPLVLLQHHLQPAMVGDHMQGKLFVAALPFQAFPAGLVIALVPDVEEVKHRHYNSIIQFDHTCKFCHIHQHPVLCLHCQDPPEHA